MTNAMIWGLACGGVLQHRNGFRLDRLGGLETGSADELQRVRECLGDWGVSTTEQARETLGWLFSVGHRAEVLALASRHDQFLMAQGHDAQFRAESFQAEWLVKYRRIVTDKTLVAWDAGRAVALANWAFALRLIGDGEAWHYIMAAAKALQHTYGSWYEIGEHYCLGYEFWAGKDGSGLLPKVQELCVDPGSPWMTLPWNMPLDIQGFSPAVTFAVPRLPAPPRPIGSDREWEILANMGRRRPEERIVKESDGADLVDSGGNLAWHDRHLYQVLPSLWRDDWGPLRNPATILEEFMMHEMAFNQTAQGDPLAAEQRLLGFGYVSVGQFMRVRNTIIKYFAAPNIGWLLDQRVLEGDRVNAAILKASRNLQTAQHAQTLSASPGLLEPVNGVSLELYAEMSAKAASISEAEFVTALANHRVDMATWLAASRTWAERMQNDKTGAVASRFTDVYMKLGTGQYGAAAQAAAATGFDGTAAAGAEPVPFERFCEMAGAIAGWSDAGLDSNEMLTKKFGVSMMDYCNISSWWFSQMTADMNLMNQYTAKVEHYQKAYAGPQPNVASDISF